MEIIKKIFIGLTTIITQVAFAQNPIKPPLDFQAADNWVKLEALSAISDDGKYIAYLIQNQPHNSNTLVVKSVNGNWKKEVIGISTALGYFKFHFTPDQRGFLFERGDSTGVLILGTDKLNLEKTKLITRETGQFRKFKWPISQTFIDDKTMAGIILSNGELWYSKSSIEEPGLLLSKKHIPDSLKLTAIQGASSDGKIIYLTFSTNRPPLPKLMDKKVRVTIWSYNDFKIQSAQIADRSDVNYSAACFIQTGELRLIGRSDNVRRIDNSDLWIESTAASDSLQLTDASSGKAELIPSKAITNTSLIIPEQQRIVYYDKVRKSYLSYEINSKKSLVLTSGVSENWEGNVDHFLNAGIPRSIPVWLPKQKRLMIFARFDIWLLDPTNVNAPICLTRRYGAEHHILYNVWPNADHPAMNKKGEILISAFDERTKEHGNYYTTYANPTDPGNAAMKKMLFCAYGRSNAIKAKNADVYLSIASKNFASPNYFTTNDFKNFKQQSFLNSEIKYNWETKILLNYRVGNDDTGQAILHKPEDFDQDRKYPVIIYYYQGLSQTMYDTDVWSGSPVLCHGPINIPWFVSHGYLVVEADVKQKASVGEAGKNALKYINAAADFVSKLPYVDSTKIGIQGHSWGGFETNYIVTHSSRFAAACSASGYSDMISQYLAGDLPRHDEDAVDYVENHFPRMKYTLWENREAYIDNSAVFSADKVMTPLLLMANKLDGRVPYLNGFEFYTALRRLKKVVWLLEYEEEGHILDKIENQEDYTVRTQQFFDHYLKGMPAPKWMIDGIPKYLKGRTTGIEFEGSGK